MPSAAAPATSDESRNLKYNFRFKRPSSGSTWVSTKDKTSRQIDGLECSDGDSATFNTGLNIGKFDATGKASIDLAAGDSKVDYEVKSEGTLKWTGSGTNAVNKDTFSKAGMKYKIKPNNGQPEAGYPKDSYASEKAAGASFDPNKGIVGGTTLTLQCMSTENSSQSRLTMGGIGSVTLPEQEGIDWNFGVELGGVSGGVSSGGGGPTTQPVVDDNFVFAISANWGIKIVFDIKSQSRKKGETEWRDDSTPAPLIGCEANDPAIQSLNAVTE